MENELEGLALVGAGVYILMVYQKGNSTALLNRLANESDFLEFLIALAIIKWCIDHDSSGLAKPLAAVAVVSIALQIAGRFNVTDALADFGQGRSGLFDTIKKIFQPKAKSRTAKPKADTTIIDV